MINAVDWSNVWENIVTWLSTSGLRLLIGIVVLLIAFKVDDKICRKISKKLEKKNADKTLSKVLVNVTRIFIKIILVGCFCGYVGLDTASIAAAITSAGLALGLALQGALSNFAGGVIILVMRPFKLDDFITSGTFSGTVEDIKLFYTYLRTPDNKMIMIPNGTLANGVIVNYSVKSKRRVDWTFSIAYEESFARAKDAILKVLAQDNRILPDVDPFVRISEQADSSINISVRVWVRSSDYWNVYFDILENVTKEFETQNINIPYNQLDVHIKNDSNNSK